MLLHFITNFLDLLGRFTLGIFQGPVLSDQPWDVRASFTTPHGDEEIRSGRQLLSQKLGLLLRHVDAELAHGDNAFRMHSLARLRSS
ncbi:hypothetical protein MPTK1_3g07260 [Marchantia polymorpha subsp. ruderalis]|uniref:Uncharacterized protein n=2 Tax=Marchantia polymorpha TaxID=3197 RepID=A0AAF6AYA7_MARPO|nr:hypothetical protein MARPO_0006s0200 [Marchantia polymorpha]BBN04741.1 hypothetical protein Mp_3g07260 [Marchantia polymorpha subsp. ruderalis]|eukprot:PTQ48186.1 hypothetical protein MARPO_0006s0200 [Marchantia polymorpha]